MIKTFLASFAGINIVHLIIAAAAIAVVAGGMGFGTGWKVNGWRLGVQVATLDGDKRELTIGAQACGRTLETQNTAIEGWRKAEAAAAAKGDGARRAALEVEQRLTPKLDRLQKASDAPAVPGEVRRCDDAVREVRGGLQP